MTERRSLGELYHEAPSPDPFQHDLTGSIGGLYSSWIEQDTSARADSPGGTRRPGALGDEWAQHVEEAAAVAAAGAAARTAEPPQPDGQAVLRLPRRPAGPRTAPPPIYVPPRRRPTGADVPAPAPGSAAPDAATAPAQGKASGGGLGRSSLLMAGGTLVSRLLGFVRGALQAAAIGVGTTASSVPDIWATANTLPNIIYLLLAGGVINAVLVPQITKSLKHEDGGKGYTDRLLTLSFCILAVVTVACVAAAPWLYRLYDVSASGARLHLGWSFALICLPQIFFYGAYALLGQVLNARGRFGAYMWAPALANVVAISGLLYFLLRLPRQAPIEDWTNPMIWVLAGSATLGIVLQALCLIPVLARDGYRFTPNFHWRGVGLRSTSTIALWAFAAVILQQIGLVVTTNVLNYKGGPGKSAQEYGFLLFMLPHSLITVSLVTALFTRMSKAANQRDHDRVREDFREGMRLIGVATIPCTVGAFVLGGPLIEAVYGSENVWAIGSFMWPMMLGLTAYGLCVMVQRVFYAYEDARTPFRMQVVCTAIAIAITLGSLALPTRLIGIGIGLSLTLSNLAQGLVGLRWLAGTTGPIPMADVVRSYVRLLVASLVAAAPTLLLALGLQRVLPGRGGALLALLLGGPVFLAVFTVIARRLRVPEVDRLVGPVLRRLGRATAR